MAGSIAEVRADLGELPDRSSSDGDVRTLRRGPDHPRRRWSHDG